MHNLCGTLVKSALAPVAALLVSVAALNTGHGLQGTLVPVRAGIEAFSTWEIGLLGSSYYLGFALGCLLGPHAVKRVGHIRVFLTMSAIASAAPLAHLVVVTPWFWWIMRMLLGLCFAALYIVIESWLNERSTNDNRGTVLSAYTVINLTVITLGQLMMTVSDPAGFLLFVIASMLVSLAAVPVGMTTSSAPAPIETVRVRIGRLFRLSPVGFTGCLAVGLANGSFWALGPLYAGRSGLDVAGIAVFMSATVIGGAVGQWPFGRWSDRTDRRRVIVTLCLLAGSIGLALCVWSQMSNYVLLALTALYGVFAFPLYAISMAHMNDFVAKNEFVEASSGLLLVFAAGAIIGPMITAAVVEQLGHSLLYACTATIHVLLAGFALWRMRKRDVPPEAERTQFTAALQAAQTVSTTFDAAQLQITEHGPHSDTGESRGT